MLQGSHVPNSTLLKRRCIAVFEFSPHTSDTETRKDLKEKPLTKGTFDSSRRSAERHSQQNNCLDFVWNWFLSLVCKLKHDFSKPDFYTLR